MSDTTNKIGLPSELYNKIEERIKTTEFQSVEEYVIFVLEEVIKDEEDAPFDEEDEKEVKARLKALGYLD